MTEIAKSTYGTLFLQEDLLVRKEQDVVENNSILPFFIREIVMLKNIRHKNVIELLSISFSNGMKTVNMFIPYVNQPGSILSSKIPWMVFQCIDVLHFLHVNKINHLDIKPGNMLIDKDYNIRLIDFGFSCISPTCPIIYCTSIYRPPEMFLNPKNVDVDKIDVWSMGASIFEIATGKFLVDVDENSSHPHKSVILKKIFEVTGMTEEFKENSKLLFYSASKSKLKEKIQTYDPTLDTGISELLEVMLEVDKSKRWTSEQLTTHPYILSLGFERYKGEFTGSVKICDEVSDIPSTEDEKIIFDVMENMCTTICHRKQALSIHRKYIEKIGHSYPENRAHDLAACCALGYTLGSHEIDISIFYLILNVEARLNEYNMLYTEALLKSISHILETLDWNVDHIIQYPPFKIPVI